MKIFREIVTKYTMNKTIVIVGNKYFGIIWFLFFILLWLTIALSIVISGSHLSYTNKIER